MQAGLKWRKIWPTGSCKPDKNVLISVKEWKFTVYLIVTGFSKKVELRGVKKDQSVFVYICCLVPMLIFLHCSEEWCSSKLHT